MQRISTGKSVPINPNEKIELGEFVELAAVDWTWPNERKREAIMNELRNVGFFVVTNVPGHDEEKLLNCAKWLCALPKEEKDRLTKKFWNMNNPNVYRGLAPFIENDPSHVEIYDMGYDYDKITPEE